MKLILENWRRHLREEEESTVPNQILYDNAKSIINDSLAHRWFEENLERLFMWEGDDLLYKILTLFEDIPPLHTWRMTSYLAEGTMGIVFNLDNGHVIKFFIEGYLTNDEGDGELDFYRSEKTKLFDKSGTTSTLPVYDQGSVDGGPASVKWVEMAKLVPLGQYWSNTGRQNERYSLGDLLGEMKHFFRVSGRTKEYFERRRDSLIRKLHQTAKEAKITSQEFRNLFLMLKAVYEERGLDYLNDAHPGNIGVLHTSAASADPAFVLFDP